MKEVDAKGKLCPQPLIMTKKALVKMDEDETLHIIVDNESSKFNVLKYLKDNGMDVEVQLDGHLYHLYVVKKGGTIEKSTPEDYCEIPVNTNSDYVVCIKKETLGEGDDELGKLLMKGFLETLPDASLLPSTLIFVNSGIYLALNESPVVDAIKTLEAKGVEVMICGTCLDYYKKMDDIAVGQVSNMLDILEKLTHTGKILNP
jgi:selenium metabolism protein YedF